MVTYRLLIVAGLLWLVFVIAGTVFINVVLETDADRIAKAIDRHGAVAADATVTRTDPRQQDTVYYEFHADGRTYHASDRSGPPNPGAASLTPGDPIFVSYDTTDPNVSCPCDPQQLGTPNHLQRALGGMIMGSVATALVAALVLLRRRRQSL
jgi:hypothetical protein